MCAHSPQAHVVATYLLELHASHNGYSNADLQKKKKNVFTINTVSKIHSNPSSKPYLSGASSSCMNNKIVSSISTTKPVQCFLQHSRA